jgi:hypothetical protein
MKRIVVLASAMILAASVTVFGQTQKPATTTTTTTTTSSSQMTSTTSDKSHTAITVAELPKAAQDYINKAYAGQKVEKAMKITDSKGTVTYKADIAGMVLHFDNAGKFLGEAKKEMKPAKEAPTTAPAQQSAPPKKQ